MSLLFINIHNTSNKDSIIVDFSYIETGSQTVVTDRISILLSSFVDFNLKLEN